MGNERVIIRMQKNSSNNDLAKLFHTLEKKGFMARYVPYRDDCLVMVEGRPDRSLALQSIPGVREVVTTSTPFPLASLESTNGKASAVEIIPGLKIGGGEKTIMAGPCAVENRDQILECAKAVKKAGAVILRGGAFKPRTNPYSFQGLGSEGIALLVEARKATGLPIISEVMSTEAIEWMLPHVDILQIGARNMQNFPLLKALGKVDKPVMLKRSPMATVDEWLQSAEYILLGGNNRVILCERGIRGVETRTRNTLDLNIVPLVKSLSHLPVIVDPSHGTGIRELVAPMSLAALASGADGLIIEVHPRPEEALSDGMQSLSVPEFTSLMQSISRLIPALAVPEGSEKKCTSVTVM